MQALARPLKWPPVFPLEKGLVLWLPFDDRSGARALDRSGKLNHGTLYGPTWVAGQRGSALNFDGVNDYGNVLNFVGLPSSQMTVEALVKIATHKTWNMMVWHDHWGAAGGWVLMSGGDGTACFSITTVKEAANVNGVKSGLQTGVWYHLVGVYDGSYVRIYVNAVEGTPGALEGFTLDSVGNVGIGAGSDGNTGFLPGLVKKVRIWNRALNAAEVKRLHESTLMLARH